MPAGRGPRPARTVPATDIESASYGVDELAAAAQLLGADAFPGVAVPQPALESARRSLLARKVLAIDDEGKVKLTAPHSALLAAAVRSSAVVTADHRRRERAETRAWYLSPETSVEHSIEIGDVHRLARIETVDLLGALLVSVELVPRPAVDASEVVTTRATLDRALAAAGRGEAAPGIADPLAGALESLESASSVRSLSRSDGRVVGGELAWLDTGAGGLWLLEPEEGRSEDLNVSRVEESAILDRLLAYLPGADEPAPPG